MSTKVTAGRERNPFAQVYDRLRKRSQRATRSPNVAFEDMVGRSTGSAMWDGSAWYRTDHLAYVAGVRDALNAVSLDREDA